MYLSTLIHDCTSEQRRQTQCKDKGHKENPPDYPYFHVEQADFCSVVRSFLLSAMVFSLSKQRISQLKYHIHRDAFLDRTGKLPLHLSTVSLHYPSHRLCCPLKVLSFVQMCSLSASLALIVWSDGPEFLHHSSLLSRRAPKVRANTQ